MEELRTYMAERLLMAFPNQYDQIEEDTTVVDLGFCRVFLKPGITIDQEELVTLIRDNIHKGYYAGVNPLDGRPHDYIQLGAWLGDQSDALAFMGLMVHAEMCQLMLPAGSAKEVKERLSQGEITIRALEKHIIPTPPKPQADGESYDPFI